jgi:hypothetical protein
VLPFLSPTGDFLSKELLSAVCPIFSDLDDLELNSSAPALWTSGSDNTGHCVIYPAYVGTSSACVAPLVSVTIRSSETFLASVALIAIPSAV